MPAPYLAHLTVPPQIFDDGPLVTRDGHRLTAEDQIALMQMPARFEWAFCSGNGEALMAMLTDDVVMDHALGHANGKDEMGGMDIPSWGLRHQFHNHVVYIDEDGDGAMLSYMNVAQVREEQPSGVSLPAIYVHLVLRDKFRRVGERWLFSRRIFEQLKFGDHLGQDEVTVRRMARTAEERAAAGGWRG